MSTISRVGSRRGDDCSEYGWSTPAGAVSSMVGALSQFGKINKLTPGVVNLGPSSVFVGKNGKNRDSASLSQLCRVEQRSVRRARDDTTVTSHTRKPDVDMASLLSDGRGDGGKLLLPPRSRPLAGVSKVDEKTRENSEGSMDEYETSSDENTPPESINCGDAA